LDIYDKKVNYLKQTNHSLESMNRYLIKKGDTLLASGDFDNAKIQYESISPTSEKMLAVSLVHLAQLYLQKG
jgi:ribosomal protein S20